MKIAIPGGTGQVGTLLARALQRDGHEVTVLARTAKPAPWRVVKWEPASLEGWAHHLAAVNTSNVASPNPLPNREFMAVLRRAWGASIGLPSTKWMLGLAAFFMRTESELILKSRHVIPARLLQAGFTFKYPHWPEAAAELCSNFRATGPR